MHSCVRYPFQETQKASQEYERDRNHEPHDDYFREYQIWQRRTRFRRVLYDDRRKEEQEAEHRERDGRCERHVNTMRATENLVRLHCAESGQYPSYFY
jgi:hypothetical protein